MTAIAERPRRGFVVGRFPGFGAATLRFFLYLYAPIAILVVFSFNAGRSATIWSGFSLEWYLRAFANDDIQRAALNSLIVASFAAQPCSRSLYRIFWPTFTLS